MRISLPVMNRLYYYRTATKPSDRCIVQVTSPWATPAIIPVLGNQEWHVDNLESLCAYHEADKDYVFYTANSQLYRITVDVSGGKSRVVVELCPTPKLSTGEWTIHHLSRLRVCGDKIVAVASVSHHPSFDQGTTAVVVIGNLTGNVYDLNLKKLFFGFGGIVPEQAVLNGDLLFCLQGDWVWQFHCDPATNTNVVESLINPTPVAATGFLPANSAYRASIASRDRKP